jgi:hypothetical protein
VRQRHPGLGRRREYTRAWPTTVPVAQPITPQPAPPTGVKAARLAPLTKRQVRVVATVLFVEELPPLRVLRAIRVSQSFALLSVCLLWRAREPAFGGRVR